MTLETIFTDKSLKAKAKVNQISERLTEGTLPIDELLAFTEQQTKSTKASCIEAIEHATKKNPPLANEPVLDFVVSTLKDDVPKVKWESARVIANICKLFPEKLAPAIQNLLKNTNHEGTVVRWATALALGEILKLKTDHNKTLLPKIEKLSKVEKDNGVNKKYLAALKKVNK